MSELEDSAGSEPPGSSSEADSRGSTSASSGSDDDDEKQPLEQRHGWAAKHSVPQPTPLGGKRRTRTNRFPKIPRSQRCGSCENCLNPQRKKACLVARQRMEQQLGGQQAAPIARQASTSSKAGVASTTSLTSTADDPFSRSLTGILSGSGGVVQERHVALLMQLVKRAKTKPHRTTLLVVLQLSSQEVLRQAVAAKLLLDVQLWLSEFVAEGRQALVQKTLACLDKLPVTLASLQPPCELGKIVGRLRKHESFGSPVIEPAKRLVARWKAMVEQSSKAGSRPATASSGAATAAAARPMTTTHAASLDRQPSANLTEDGDLFKGTDKQRTGIKEPVPGTKKVTIKTIAVEATRGKAADTSLPAAFPSTSAASSGDPAAANKPASEASLTNAAAQSEVDKVGTSPFVSYSNLGGGVTVLGGGTSSGLSVPLSTVGPGSGGAKDRAAAAARRVPSPEPHPRKEKSKKVRWQEDKAIMGVRWFRKDDPPAAARQDADSAELPRGAPAAPAAPELPPPGFESAAKKEHLSEAAALRRHRAEEDQERIALVDALAHMVATTAWLSPADNDAMSDAELATMPAPPARGEDSTEASRFAVWRQQEPAVVYAQLSAVPATPGEPRAAADCGLAQHPATIPRIPLSLEAAAQQQQQQQQPAPYAPPVQDVGQAIQLQQQRQQEQQQQQLERPAATPPVSDIGAALAQLAASGILSGAAGGGAAGASSVHLPQHNRGAPAQDSSYAWQNHHGRQADPHQRQQHQQQQQQQQQHQQQHPPPRRSYPGQRPCRFFNTPKGCFMGDRCHFAHDAPPGGISNGAKRPADDSNGWQHQSAFKRGRT